MISTAYALGQSGAGAEGASPGGMLIPMVLMFVIFYFLLIRPQQKKAKEHRAMINAIKKGDRIVTTGGLYGRVTGDDDTTLTVEIAEKVRVKIARGNIAGVITPNAPKPAEKSTK